MRILAIETSCDETSAAIVKDGRIVLANVVASQVELFAHYGGVIPELAARTHVEKIIPVIDQCLTEAKLGWKEIDAIAVAIGPGLIGSLIIGTETAKTLALLKNKPLISVNHLEGHIYANWLGQEEPLFPLLALIVSGGHSLIVEMPHHYDFKIIGETRDDSAGEAFDKVAQLLGLPYPGGPSIALAAKEGRETAYRLPVVDLTPPPRRDEIGFLKNSPPSLDFSFSGLKTAVLNIVKQQKMLSQSQKNDLAATFQNTVSQTIEQNIQRAIDLYQPKSLILAGGVGANQHLRETLAGLTKKNKIRFTMPAMIYCTDNAAMIGAAAYYCHKHENTRNKKTIENVTPNPVLTLD